MKIHLILYGLLIGWHIPCNAGESYNLTPAEPIASNMSYEDKLDTFLNMLQWRQDTSEDDVLNEASELLGLGMNVNERGLLQRTLLMGAVVRNFGSLMEMLLAEGADLSLRDVDGMTALMLCAYHGHAKLCELLIDHMERKNKEKRQYGAIARSFQERIGLCDIKGALQVLAGYDQDSVDARDTYEMTALMYAARSLDRATIALLIQRGAQVNAQNRSGHTPLMQACGVDTPSVERSWPFIHRSQLTVSKASTAGVEACTELLIRGAHIAILDNTGSSALIHAAAHLREDVCRLLLAHGAETIALRPDTRSHYTNDFMLATLYGRENCMTILLTAGIPMNAQNRGATALHNAASKDI